MRIVSVGNIMILIVKEFSGSVLPSFGDNKK